MGATKFERNICKLCRLLTKSLCLESASKSCPTYALIKESGILTLRSRSRFNLFLSQVTVSATFDMKSDELFELVFLWRTVKQNARTCCLLVPSRQWANRSFWNGQASDTNFFWHNDFKTLSHRSLLSAKMNKETKNLVKPERCIVKLHFSHFHHHFTFV